MVVEGMAAFTPDAARLEKLFAGFVSEMLKEKKLPEVTKAMMSAAEAAGMNTKDIPVQHHIHYILRAGLDAQLAHCK